MVQTSAGPVQGFDRTASGQAVSTFFALPFAEPPVGAKRFHYPEPFAGKWTETRHMTAHSPVCVQGGILDNTSEVGSGANRSEDCLYLNVYAPRKAIGNSSLLPVMFWIYGGGFKIGDAYERILGQDMYDGLQLAARHDVVLVSVNYRLSMLGFNTFTKGPNGQTGTQAMEDQRLAMQWVQENIHGFGGDPARVTIFGESAGAFSVMYHLVSPPSWPYFSKAIMQSGTSSLSWFFQPFDLVKDLDASWAEALSCPSGPDQLACLQTKPALSFVDAPAGFVGRSPVFAVFPFGPVIDGTPNGLVDLPSTLVQQGKLAQVPLLLGSNRDGGSIFEPMISRAVPGVHFEAFDQADVDKVLNWTLTPEDSARIKALYQRSEFSSLGLRTYQQMLARIMRDLGFECSNRRLATGWHAHNLPAYLYAWDYDFGPLDKVLTLGDFHGSDIVFVFRTFLWLVRLMPLRGDASRMADIVSCLWTSFAYSGNPNGGNDASSVPPNCGDVHGKVAEWPAFDESRQFYNLNDQPKVMPLRASNMYPDDSFTSDTKCDVWDTVQYPWHAKAQQLAAIFT